MARSKVRRLLPWFVIPAAVIVQFVVLATVLPMIAPIAVRVYDVFPTAKASEPVAGADTSGDGPGSLVSATTLPLVTRTFEGNTMRAARILYRSTSGDTGESTVVSGAVFLPTGTPPAGGWPVIAYAHGTLGIDPLCGPSLYPDLLGSLPVMAVMTKLGYAVAMPDFQGLGANGIHPYPDEVTAGRNVLDSVRALRHAYPETSSRWAAIGGSQGGGAVWSADEEAPAYAPELQLLGVAATSPPTDVSPLVDKAATGTLTTEQGPIVQAIVESLARLHPDLDRNDYRRGSAATYWNVLSNCDRARLGARALAVRALGPRDFAPHSPEAAARLRDLLRAWAIPRHPLSAPMYVWYGGKDPFVDAAWTRAAIARTCAMGASVTVDFDPDGGHNPRDALTVLHWVIDRFAGKPPVDDCPPG